MPAGYRYFNPRSREGSDLSIGFRATARNISIHAPAKGATDISITSKYPFGYFNPRSREGSDLAGVRVAVFAHMISIHAPAKGATLMHFRSTIFSLGFQSTLPRRERPPALPPIPRAPSISIHAPAKGATTRNDLPPTYTLFQSTLPRRERPCCPVRRSPSCGFQSTLPRRERLGMCCRTRLSRAYFNPRSREGSDKTNVQTRCEMLISIHAPAKGATCILIFLTQEVGFQSTLPRRERHVAVFRLPFGMPFQSTLPRRERPPPQPSMVGMFDFNPRSREGSDRERGGWSTDSILISIHAPAKGATAKITKTIPNDFGKINNYNNSFA